MILVVLSGAAYSFAWSVDRGAVAGPQEVVNGVAVVVMGWELAAEADECGAQDSRAPRPEPRWPRRPNLTHA